MFKSKSFSLSAENTLFASFIVNLFSYRALPTITPESPEFSNFTNDNKSEIEPTPPAVSYTHLTLPTRLPV